MRPAIVVVGWTEAEARRADRKLEWAKAVQSLSWAAKLILICMAIGTAIASQTVSGSLMWVVVILAIAAIGFLVQSVRRSIAIDYDSRDLASHGWMVAGRFVYATLDINRALLAAVSEQDMDEQGELSFDRRFLARDVEGVSLRPGSEAGFHRLQMRLLLQGAGMTSTIEIRASAEEAARMRDAVVAALNRGRSDECDECGARARDLIGQLTTVLPEREFGDDTLVIRVAAAFVHQESLFRTHSVFQVVARSIIYWLLTTTFALIASGCFSGTYLMATITIIATSALWLLIGLISARKAMGRRAAGGGDHLVIGPSGAARALDFVVGAVSQCATGIAPRPSSRRPDRRVRALIGLVANGAYIEWIELGVDADDHEAHELAGALGTRITAS